MKKLLPLLALLLFPFITQAKAVYSIEVEIFNADSQIGSPALMIEQGVKAKVSEGDLYDLSLLATPSGENRVLIQTDLKVSEENYTPSVLVEVGKKAKVSIGDTTLTVLITNANANAKGI